MSSLESEHLSGPGFSVQCCAVQCYTVRDSLLNSGGRIPDSAAFQKIGMHGVTRYTRMHRRVPKRKRVCFSMRRRADTSDFFLRRCITLLCAAIVPRILGKQAVPPLISNTRHLDDDKKKIEPRRDINRGENGSVPPPPPLRR